MYDTIELYQLMPDNAIISLGGTVLAEVQAVSVIEKYPDSDIHVFFGRRAIAPCDPPVLEDEVNALDQLDSPRQGIWDIR